MLVTLTPPHPEPYDRIRERLLLSHDGIAVLEFVGATDAGNADALVERLPFGHPPMAPLHEAVIARLGSEIAGVVVRVHAAGEVVGGIRPELVYVGPQSRLTALAPRGPEFIAGAPIAGGMRTYYVPYLAPELLDGAATAPPADVFATCATLYYLATGQHPFGDPQRIAEMVGTILKGSARPWPGSHALGAIVMAGLARRAADRPSSFVLAEQLSRARLTTT
jgi:serine/threonine protein kinase